MTTTNVVVLPVETTLDIPANRVLNSAITEPPLDAVLVIGKKDGKFYLASNTGKLAEILLLLRRGGRYRRRFLLVPVTNDFLIPRLRRLVRHVFDVAQVHVLEFHGLHSCVSRDFIRSRSLNHRSA